MSRPGAFRALVAVVVAGTVLTACGDASDGADRSAPATSSTTAPTAAAAPPTTAPVTTAAATANDRVDGMRLADLPAYAGVTWADQLQAEQRSFDGTPRVTTEDGRYAVQEFTGTHLNVRGAERVTPRSTCRGCPVRTLWLLGSATAFGLGQRDRGTVAAHLVRLAAADGVDLRVRNLAATGMTKADEERALTARLAGDAPPPDLVVALDGFNDVLATYMYANVRDGKALDPIRFDDSWIDEFIAVVPSPELPADRLAPLADHVATVHRQVNARMRTALERAGIGVAFCFEPDGFVSARQAEGLAATLGADPRDVAERSQMAALLRMVTDRLGDDVHDLREPLAAVDRPLYADTNQVNEDGAERIAGLVYDRVASDLR